MTSVSVIYKLTFSFVKRKKNVLRFFVDKKSTNSRRFEIVEKLIKVAKPAKQLINFLFVN